MIDFKHITKYAAFPGIFLLLAACSIRPYQSSEAVLYTGIKSIQIEDSLPRNKHLDSIIATAEQQLSYAPNNAIFGSSTLRWPLPLIGPYLYLKYADSKTFIGKTLHRLGSKPKWLDEVNPKLRAEVTKRILGEAGYLGAEVTSEPIYSDKDKYEAKINYRIKLGPQYLIDSVAYLPSFRLNDSTIFTHKEHSAIQTGQPFSIDLLSKDRTYISQILRNSGYYFFTPSYISYEADSLKKSQVLQLRCILQKETPAQALRQWRIGRINVRFFDQDFSNEGTNLSHSFVDIDSGVRAYTSGHLPIRRKVLNTLLKLRPDSIYRQSLEERTIRGLSNIGAFTNTEITYTPQLSEDEIKNLPEGEVALMDMNVVMQRDKIWDASLGGQFMHKTTNFIGPGANFSLARKNLFGGGESLSINASGSYEWQTGHSPFSSSSLSLNSFQLGADASLTFPTLLLPKFIDKYYHTNASTTVRLSWQFLNRAGFYGLRTLGTNISYDYQPNEVSTHSLTPLSLDYTQLSHTTETFDRILKDNPSLSLSLRSQFIPATSYTYTMQKALDDVGDSRLWWRTSVKEAGNLIKGTTMLFGHKFNETNKIFGVPYAQFVRLSSEARFTRQMTRTQGFATRLAVGAIYSFGNSRIAPYTEQFFIGGANSIRAFTVRSLGPGRFRESGASTSYSFMDHVGEFKLELNGEYRYKLTPSLELATFIDAGNIWLLHEDTERPGGSLGEISGLSQFLNQIAVGTGVGVRYDATYLLLRLDMGIGLHLPYATSRKGWYNIPKFGDGFGIHLAIGYPF